MPKHLSTGRQMMLFWIGCVVAIPPAAFAAVIIDSTGGPYLLSAGEDLLVSATAHDTDGLAMSSSWQLANHASVNLPGVSGTITWASVSATTSGLPRNQPFTFGLTVTNSQGAAASSVTQLTIYDVQPIAAFSLDPNPAPLGSGLNLDASASFAPDPRRVLGAYLWDINPASADFTTWTTDFAGKTYSMAAADALNFFPTPGTYTIGLRVVDDAGHVQGTLKTLTVNAVPEPPTWSMLLAGLLSLSGLAGGRRSSPA